MSHGNGSSAFIFQVTGFLKPVTGSADPGVQHSHSKMVGITHFMGQILIYKCPILVVSTFGENWHFLGENYSIKHNDKVLI